MIQQILFLLFLYLTGVLFVGLFKKHIPFSFACISGFFWGALVWCLVFAVLLIYHVPSPWLSQASLGVLALGFIVMILVNILSSRLGFSRTDLKLLIISTAAFVGVVALASTFNYTVLSYDSYVQVNMGRAMAIDGGFIPSTQYLLASWSLFMPLLQSASIPLKIDYMYALQPALAYTLVLCFYYMVRLGVIQLAPESRVARSIPLLATAAMCSTYFLVFEAFYIHNSLPAALCLLVSVGGMWLALEKENQAWLYLSILPLIGLVFLRAEGPFVGIIFLTLLVASGRLSYLTRLTCTLIYVGFCVFWYANMLLLIGSGTDILDPSKLMIIIQLLVTFAIFIALTRFKWAERLMHLLPVIMLVALLAAFIATCSLKPEHMSASTTWVIRNMSYYGRWGITWWVLAFALVAARFQPRLPNERIFFTGIMSFLIVVCVLVYMRDDPYRQGWGDSGNRILTHIVPICFFYVALKCCNGLRPRADKKAVAASGSHEASSTSP